MSPTFNRRLSSRPNTPDDPLRGYCRFCQSALEAPTGRGNPNRRRTRVLRAKYELRFLCWICRDRLHGRTAVPIDPSSEALTMAYRLIHHDQLRRAHETN